MECDKEEGPAPTGPGTGGSGNGGEGTGASRCACVSKGMGGTGPSPPTGSGSGSGPAPPTGSGSGSGCPASRPDFNTRCNTAEEGLSCEYGTQTCCGETYPEIVMECMDKEWAGYFADTVCILGGTCPVNTTTAVPGCVCPEIWTPVCGSDGNTYSNQCFANCAGATTA